MARNSKDQRRLQAIRARVQDLRSSNREACKQNNFIHLPAGDIVGEMEFLLQEIDRLEGRGPVDQQEDVLEEEEAAV